MDYPSTSSISSIRRSIGPFRSKTINRRSSKHRISKLDIKNAFNEIFKEEVLQEETLKDRLQSKVDFFYSAYNHDNTSQKYMKFDEKSNSTSDLKDSKDSKDLKVVNKFDKKAIANWNWISNQILVKDKNKLRSFLRTVNQDMYLNLIKVGVKFLSKGSNQIGEFSSSQDSNNEFKKGIEMLKQVIQEKIMGKSQTELDKLMPKSNQNKNMANSDYLTPLVMISKGKKNQNFVF
jgi:hypothetical protein